MARPRRSADCSPNQYKIAKGAPEPAASAQPSVHNQNVTASTFLNDIKSCQVAYSPGLMS